MTTMNTTVNLNSADINFYWNLVKDMTSAMKVELITKLSASLINSTSTKTVESDKVLLDRICAQPQKPYSMTAEEYIEEITSSRKVSRQIVEI